MPGQLLSAVPIFASSDFARTISFYESFGYQFIGDNDGRYLIMRCDGAELHFNFNPNVEPKTNYKLCYIRVLNVHALGEAWAGLGWPTEDAPRYVPFGLQDHGMIEAHTIDHDGNLIIYGAADEDRG